MSQNYSPWCNLTNPRTAGSDNTSITVSIAIYFLLAHREYYDRLYAELAETFPDPMASVNLDELTTLPFLNGVTNETLRLASPYFNPRVVPAGGILVDGQFIPEKTVVALAAHSQQLSEENFYPAPKVRMRFMCVPEVPVLTHQT